MDLTGLFLGSKLLFLVFWKQYFFVVIQSLSALELCRHAAHQAARSLKVKVAQLCPTLCNPMDHTVYGILQARTLEWVAIPFSRGSSPGDLPHPGIELGSPSLQADSLPAEPPGRPQRLPFGKSTKPSYQYPIIFWHLPPPHQNKRKISYLWITGSESQTVKNKLFFFFKRGYSWRSRLN